MRPDARKLFLEAFRSGSRELRSSARPRSDAGPAIGDREAREIAGAICEALGPRPFRQHVLNDISEYLDEAHAAATGQLADALAETLRGLPAEQVAGTLQRYDDRIVHDAARALQDLERALAGWSRQWQEVLLSVASTVERATR